MRVAADIARGTRTASASACAYTPGGVGGSAATAEDRQVSQPLITAEGAAVGVPPPAVADAAHHGEAAEGPEEDEVCGACVAHKGWAPVPANQRGSASRVVSSVAPFRGGLTGVPTKLGAGKRPRTWPGRLPETDDPAAAAVPHRRRVAPPQVVQQDPGHRGEYVWRAPAWRGHVHASADLPPPPPATPRFADACGRPWPAPFHFAYAITVPVVDVRRKDGRYNRWLIVANCFAMPVWFIVCTGNAELPLGENSRFDLWELFLIISVATGLLGLFLTRGGQRPKYHNVRAPRWRGRMG